MSLLKETTSVVLGMLLCIAADGQNLSLSTKSFETAGAQDLSLSTKNFKKAVRLLEKDIIGGNWEGVQAPLAAVELFPQLAHEFNRATAVMGANEDLRWRPQVSGDVIRSYERDMQVREDFNRVLKELRQDVGKLEERFRDLDRKFAEQKAQLKAEEEAFRESWRILKKDIAPVVGDPDIRHLRITWPEGLPEETRDVFDTLVTQLLATQYSEARAAKWEHLTGVFQRLHNIQEAGAQETMREMELQKKWIKRDPDDFFRNLGFSIAHCIVRNEEANERSAQMRDAALGK